MPPRRPVTWDTQLLKLEFHDQSGFHQLEMTVSGGGGGGSGDEIEVNGSAATSPVDFNDTTPAAPTSGTIDDLNVTWQKSGSNVSAYVNMDDLNTLLVTQGTVGTFVTVDGTGPLSAAAFNDTTPAAPAGAVNVHWQESATDVSSYVDAQELMDEFALYDPRFGDGSDGAVTETGNRTLAADVLATDYDLAGFTITLAGFRIFATGTLTGGGGIIQNNGANGSPGTGGNSSTTGTGPMAPGGNGSGGGNNANGSNVAARTDMISQLTTNGGAGDGTSGKGGVGGISGTGRSGGTVGAVTPPGAGSGRDPAMFYAGVLQASNGQTELLPGQGGSGGGSDSAFGGGGGGGAGIAMVCARKVVVGAGLTIRANGGNGGNGSGTNSGGGGGGGGGHAQLIAARITGSPTLQATGGAGGTATGTGVAGASGGAGTTKTVLVA